VIDYGDRARLGILVPSGNTVAEPELRAMLPSGVGMSVARVPLVGSSEAELRAMIDRLEEEAVLVGHAKPDRIAFHCTAVSTFAPHWADDIRTRIQGATGIPAFATADGIVAALRTFAVRRAILVTPYIQPVHDREIAWLRSLGVETVGGASMGVNTNTEMARISPADLAGFARQAAKGLDADLLFFSCTAVRSAGIVADLEQALGMPVLTSNQALAWHALRELGISDRIEGFGRLFAA